MYIHINFVLWDINSLLCKIPDVETCDNYTYIGTYLGIQHLKADTYLFHFVYCLPVYWSSSAYDLSLLNRLIKHLTKQDMHDIAWASPAHNLDVLISNLMPVSLKMKSSISVTVFSSLSYVTVVPSLNVIW